MKQTPKVDNGPPRPGLIRRIFFMGPKIPKVIIEKGPIDAGPAVAVAPIKPVVIKPADVKPAEVKPAVVVGNGGGGGYIPKKTTQNYTKPSPAPYSPRARRGSNGYSNAVLAVSYDVGGGGGRWEGDGVGVGNNGGYGGTGGSDGGGGSGGGGDGGGRG